MNAPAAPPAFPTQPAASDGAPDLVDWLTREGRLLPNPGELLSRFSERVVAAGIPLERASLQLRALHARYRGVARVWEPGRPLDERYLDHGIEKTATWLESPMRAVVEGGRRLDWRLDHAQALPFGLLEELREQGFTHYMMAPVVFSVGLVNAVAWATRRPGGFAPAAIDLFDAVLPTLSAVVELRALRRFIETMLNTYVGEEPTRLILDGQVRRGDVRTITAALMLIDLRDFTLLSDRLGPRAVIRLLNEYFDCVFPAVHRHHGEIMEIMGDGVLAIFHPALTDDESEACRAALNAAQEALAAIAERNRRERPGEPVLQAGVALHYGTASYGNIGSGDRLDFTIIGADVNLTSRIERFCRELDRSLIMSEAFAAMLGQPVWELGHFELRGFARMQRLFELPPETPASDVPLD